MKFYIRAIERKTGKVLFTKEFRDCRITGTPETPQHTGLNRLLSIGGGKQSPYDLAPWDTPKEYRSDVDYWIFGDQRCALVQQGNSTELGNFTAIASLEKIKTYALFVHVDKHNYAYNYKFNPWEYLCRIDPSYNPAHVHVDIHTRDGKSTKDVIWYKEAEVSLPVGNYEITVDTWIKQMPDTKAPNFSKAIKGSVGKITSNVKVSNGVKFQYITFEDIGLKNSAGWIPIEHLKSTLKAVTPIAPIVIPTIPIPITQLDRIENDVKEILQILKSSPR